MRMLLQPLVDRDTGNVGIEEQYIGARPHGDDVVR